MRIIPTQKTANDSEEENINNNINNQNMISFHTYVSLYATDGSKTEDKSNTNKY